ncbi:MAG: phosphate ABC transporter substrate-binding protein PstS [Nitrososphaerales archaeon]|jgi:phosphate transport system substrate-binding protein
MSTRNLVIGVVVILVIIVAAFGAYALSKNGASGSSTSSSTSSPSSTSSVDDPYLMSGTSQVTVQSGGSSFVNPIMQVWYLQYSDLTQNRFQLSYVAIGSGAGITNILDNAFEFAGSDAPVPASELNDTGGNTLLQIPEALGGVAIFYNVPGIDNASLDLTGPILAGIWNESITMWNAPQIQALNPKVPLPDQAIVPCHRSDGSGTTYAFTTYLNKIDPAWNASVGVGTVVNWPTNELAAAGSGGIALLVSQTPYSIGYVDTYYASNNKIPIGAIQNAAGNFELPTTATISSAANDYTTQLQSNPTFSITDAPGTNSYPISTFTYVLIWEQQTDQVQGNAAVTFLWYVVHWGQNYSATLGYAPLPSNIVTIDEGLIKEIAYNGQAFIS